MAKNHHTRAAAARRRTWTHLWFTLGRPLRFTRETMSRRAPAMVFLAWLAASSAFSPSGRAPHAVSPSRRRTPMRPDAPAPLLRLALPVVDWRRRADANDGPTEGPAEPAPRRRPVGEVRMVEDEEGEVEVPDELRPTTLSNNVLRFPPARRTEPRRPCCPLSPLPVFNVIVPNKQENLETRRRPHARAHAADNILTSVRHPTNNRSDPTDHPTGKRAARLADTGPRRPTSRPGPEPFQRPASPPTTAVPPPTTPRPSTGPHQSRPSRRATPRTAPRRGPPRPAARTRDPGRRTPPH